MYYLRASGQPGPSLPPMAVMAARALSGRSARAAAIPMMTRARTVARSLTRCRAVTVSRALRHPRAAAALRALIILKTGAAILAIARLIVVADAITISVNVIT